MLSTKHIQTSVDRNQPTRKLTPKFIGPYRIIEQISQTAYKLDLPVDLRIHPVFHISLLKKYTTSDEFLRPILPLPVIIQNSDEVEYEVEIILDKKLLRKKPYYLVKWKGYPLHDATWEPVTNLSNAIDLVNTFENQRGR